MDGTLKQIIEELFRAVQTIDALRAELERLKAPPADQKEAA